MAESVYVLCALTSLACAVLLLRGYAHKGTRLLLWSGLCFLALACENALLFLDLVVLPEMNLGIWRMLVPTLGMAALVYGLVWEDA